MPLLQSTSNETKVYWVAACLEYKLQIAAALVAHQEQGSVIQTLKPSQMNRLQRSIVSDRAASVAKDSTVRVSSFLMQTLNSINSYLNAQIMNSDHWKVSAQEIFCSASFNLGLVPKASNHVPSSILVEYIPSCHRIRIRRGNIPIPSRNWKYGFGRTSQREPSE